MLAVRVSSTSSRRTVGLRPGALARHSPLVPIANCDQCCLYYDRRGSKDAIDVIVIFVSLFLAATTTTRLKLLVALFVVAYSYGELPVCQCKGSVRLSSCLR